MYRDDLQLEQLTLTYQQECGQQYSETSAIVAATIKLQYNVGRFQHGSCLFLCEDSVLNIKRHCNKIDQSFDQVMPLLKPKHQSSFSIDSQVGCMCLHFKCPTLKLLCNPFLTLENPTGSQILGRTGEGMGDGALNSL